MTYLPSRIRAERLRHAIRQAEGKRGSLPWFDAELVVRIAEMRAELSVLDELIDEMECV